MLAEESYIQDDSLGGIQPAFKINSTGINTNYLSSLVQIVTEI
jgi:hypothetical protein